MSSVAAVATSPVSSVAASTAAAAAPDHDFDSVLASYAPANDTTPVQPQSVPAVSLRDVRNLTPKEIKAVERARPVADNARTDKAKDVRAAKGRKGSDAKQTDTTPKDAKSDDNVSTAVQTATPVAPQTAPSPTAIAVSALASQTTAPQSGDSSNDDATAPGNAGVVVVAKLNAAVREQTNSADARTQDVPQDKQASVPKVQSVDTPQIKSAIPLSKPALDAIVEAAKAQTQQPTPSTTPSAPSGSGNLAAMLSAVRGTISSILTPKQPAAPKADSAPAPATSAANTKADTGEIGRADENRKSTQDDRQPTQDTPRDQMADASDMLSASDTASAAPSSQPASPGAATANQIAAVAPPSANNVSQSAVSSGASLPAQTPAQPDVQPDLSALATAIAAKSAAGTKTFDIRMDPPELGRIDVHLSVDRDGKVQALLSAEHPQTLEMLQRDSQSLERALRDSGLNLSNNSLSFSLKGEGRQGDGGGASMARARSLPDAVVARAEAANASVSNFNHASGNGRLDIRV